MTRTPLRPIAETERAARLARLPTPLGLDLLPLNLTPAERTAAMDAPPASPTGTPLVAGSGLVLKLAVLVVAIASVVLVSDFFPGSGLDEKIAGGILALGTMLGIASPGVRKQP